VGQNINPKLNTPFKNSCSIQVAHKASNARPRVKIGEYYLSSNNQHGQNEKEHANFHG